MAGKQSRTSTADVCCPSVLAAPLAEADAERAGPRASPRSPILSACGCSA